VLGKVDVTIVSRAEWCAEIVYILVEAEVKNFGLGWVYTLHSINKLVKTSTYEFRRLSAYPSVNL